MQNILSITLLACLFVPGCSTARQHGPSTEKAFEPLVDKQPEATSNEIRLCEKWKYNVNGNLSYLATSADGSHFLVSSSSDKKNKKAMGSRVRLISNHGTTKWSKWLRQPVKGQSLGRDGALAAVTNYEDKVYLFDGKGKIIFNRNHQGTPHILEPQNKLIIVNDDDSFPNTAFFSYALSTHLKRRQSDFKEAKLPIHVEAIDVFLNLKFTTDIDPTLSVVATDNHLRVFDMNAKLLTDIPLAGKPVGSVSINGYAYALTADPGLKYGQILEAYDYQNNNKLMWSVRLDQHYETIRFLSDGKDSIVFLYGNSSRGQIVTAISTVDGKRIWSYSYKQSLTYWSPVIVLNQTANYQGVAVLLVDKSGVDSKIETGTLNLVGINTKGESVFDVPVTAPNGIYSFVVTENELSVLIGAGDPGDAVLHYFVKCEQED